MFPTLLLLTGSLIALSASLISGRAKPDTYDSPLLQKENWLGYSLLSVGLAVAAVYRFLQFRHVYEIEQNHHFGLDYFGIDWYRPIPLIYGALALVVACYVVWLRRRKPAWREEKRRLLKEIVVLTVLSGLVTLGCFVWPTPWIYSTLTPSNIAEMSGSLDGLSYYQGQPVTHFRHNRFTKEDEAKIGEKWKNVRDWR